MKKKKEERDKCPNDKYMKKQNPFLVTEAQNGWDGKGPLEIA